MAYLTLNEISPVAFSKASNLNESIRSSSLNDTPVFLSYRREDRDRVVPIVRLLKRIGVSVYIDYLDVILEDKENAEVAQSLRDRIASCKKFISLSTPNSSKSKWMPWELGLGDRILNYKNVAMLPLTRLADLWGDQEYGAIYGKIENTLSVGWSRDETWYVIYPSGEKINLKRWLTQV